MSDIMDKYKIELTVNESNYAKQIIEKWNFNCKVDWKDLPLNEKIVLLKHYGYYVSDNVVYGCKIVSEDYGSIFNIIIYNKLGEYIDEIPREEIEDHKEHGPGLWALSFKRVEDIYKLNNKRRKRRVIIVSYDINDVILVGGNNYGHLKAYKFNVVDLEPKFKFIEN
jgi:hypothetical protein